MKTKEDRAATWKRLFYALFVLTLMSLAMGFYFQAQLKQEKVKTEACMELMIFNVEQIGYLIDRFNITIDDFSADFLRFKVEEMIEEDKDE